MKLIYVKLKKNICIRGCQEFENQRFRKALVFLYWKIFRCWTFYTTTKQIG